MRFAPMPNGVCTVATTFFSVTFPRLAAPMIAAAMSELENVLEVMALIVADLVKSLATAGRAVPFGGEVGSAAVGSGATPAYTFVPLIDVARNQN